LSTPGIDVLGIGNAIVDVLGETDESALERYGLVKGTMALVDREESERVYGEMGESVEVSGGSAANTIVGLASLGSRAAYVGKVRDDSLGQVFRRDLLAAGVRFETPPAADGPPTGRCLVFVTRDAQRTMQTYLGASATLGPADIDAAAVADAAVVYLEGYQWDSEPAQQAFLLAARTAHEAGRRVAFTLSDPFCVARHREEFLAFTEAHVDILFANETEIVSLFEAADLDSAAGQAGQVCDVAALTCGERGSVVIAAGERFDVPAARVERVLDTTGAGDLYASGFLHGWTSGRDAATCARIGGIAAAEVIGHYGARPETSLRDLVGRKLTTS
jgi:sugar/nucleoside kinase (ribokinase family)